MGSSLRAIAAAFAAIAVLLALAGSASAAVGPPETTITETPPDAVADGRATFSFTADEPVHGFECRVDGQPWADCESPHTTAPQTQGDHLFSVRAIDVDDETDPTPATAFFVVDKSIAGANAAAPLVARVGRKGPIVIRVTVTAGENVVVTADGVVGTGGRRVKLPRSAPLALAAGTERKIALRPRASGARRIRRELRRKGSALAVMHATFTDALGNSATTGVIGVRLEPR